MNVDKTKFAFDLWVSLVPLAFSLNPLWLNVYIILQVHEMQFDDGSSPVPEIVDDWLHLIRDRFRENSEACVAVHCVAGLGRAPVLVALALVELGMKFEDAVEHIRSLRRGAINARQLSYLEKYRAKNRLKQRRGSESNAQSNWLSTVAKKILKK